MPIDIPRLILRIREIRAKRSACVALWFAVIFNPPSNRAIYVSVAVKVVNNILLGSQAIVAILYRSGLSLEQIARVAPKIQV